MVVAPEHPIVAQLKDKIENYEEVLAYKEEAAKKSDFERTEMAKEKTGVPLKGIMAVNPVNNREIPIWISDYVLISYGTGAIMAVPAHDERDWAFAKKFGLQIIEVVKGGDVQNEAYTEIENGTLINSGFLDGLSVTEAKKTMIQWLAEQGLGHKKVNYKLRDWVFSRQRYWGEPIPLVYCEHCGWAPVPEKDLPVRLPDIQNYMQTDSGESPLVNVPEWVDTTCPVCGAPAKRETDTMPQWAGSSWYFIRYCDPHNDQEFISKEAMEYWLPVDWYNGGMEHTTLHLLYSRFWHRFLYDTGAISCPEPYVKRTSHGMILGENGEKMSKSRGNVINPDDIVQEIGADAFRVYEMFMGAFDQAIPWSTQGARGCLRFLDRVWKLQDLLTDEEEISQELKASVHTAIKKVSEDYEKLKFNTAVAAMMSLVNEIYAQGRITRGELRSLLLILNPVAPHITEEIWQQQSLSGQPIFRSAWPSYDEKAMQKEEVEIAIQICGKVKLKLMVPTAFGKDETEQFVLENGAVRKQLADRPVRKVIVVPGRIVNIVV